MTEISDLHERAGPSRRLSILLGLVLPVVCLVADVIVFQEGGPLTPSSSVFGRFRLFAYVLSAIGLSSLAISLWRAPGPPLLAGVFWVCALFSAGVGTLLLPMSLPGVFFYGLGLLGLVPLVTAPVYWHASRRVLRASIARLGTARAHRALWLGTLLALAVPGLPQVVGMIASDRLVVKVVDGTAGARDLELLARLRPCSDLKPVALAYRD